MVNESLIKCMYCGQESRTLIHVLCNYDISEKPKVFNRITNMGMKYSYREDPARGKLVVEEYRCNACSNN